MSTAALIFPHQLFADHPALTQAPARVVFVEEPLFFGDPQYPARFHRQKLWYHRATMAHFAAGLREAGHHVEVETYRADTGLLAALIKRLEGEGVTKVRLCDPVDHTLTKRLTAAASDVELELLDTPGFLNTAEDNRANQRGKKKWFMAEYYKAQRRRLDVLMDGDEPHGGQWSFDEYNRKKVPAKMLSSIPRLPDVEHDEIDEAARDSLSDFDAIGSVDRLIYPTTHAGAALWLQKFLHQRFALFGDYEDAVVRGESWLWHGVLTPMLNTGLLTPKQILAATLAHAAEHDVPLNSLEGFIRQIIGWREFMRATYEDLHVQMRTTNHWKHTRKMPASFYDGTTGIDPIDDTIHRILKTGYCHHIERLMVLGGFMFLCEIDPDDVYRWFMEMFIDSYDWVMVPNTYAMSQHADGGLITTKPYFSGSNYIKKMSNWKPGSWAEKWDGLYWRFIWQHREELGGNPRWAMMVRTAEKMDEAKMQTHLSNAEAFLDRLK
ncbi:MAG: cryptochrome/photolyase family protein [Rhodobacteraceae bacterium]|nr:cryptochrome/photolyase family protein [Paracoccaceae bacterium]